MAMRCARRAISSCRRACRPRSTSKAPSRRRCSTWPSRSLPPCARRAGRSEGHSSTLNTEINQETTMPNETTSSNAETNAEKKVDGQDARRGKPINLGINLVPAQQSDQPVLANFSLVNVAPGMAFIDFGFIEPRVLAALPSMALSGGKMPERIDGRLAVRVAIGFDAVQSLQQQLARILTGLEAARDANKENKAGRTTP